MSYDFHFECGRHEKHNNWVMHTFVMLLLYQLNIWGKDTLETELLFTAMARNQAMNLDTTSRKPAKSKKGKPMQAIISIEKVSPEALDNFEGHVVRDTDDKGNIAEAWVAKVTFKGNADKKDIEDFMKNGEHVIKHAIQQAKRSDYLIGEFSNNPHHKLFIKLAKNDGETITPNEAAFLLSQFMSIKKPIHKIWMENVPVNIPSLVGNLAYSVGGQISFRVY